jgi:hypothetical protein
MATVGCEYFHNAMAAIARGLGTRPLSGLSDEVKHELAVAARTDSMPEVRRRIVNALTTRAMECARIPQPNLGGLSALEYLEPKKPELARYLDLGMFNMDSFDPGESQISLALQDAIQFAFGFSLAMADRTIGHIALGELAVSNVHSLIAMSEVLKDGQFAAEVIVPSAKAAFDVFGNTYMVQDDRTLPVTALAFGANRDLQGEIYLRERDAVIWSDDPDGISSAVPGRAPSLDPDLRDSLARTMTAAGRTVHRERDQDSDVEDERSSGCPVVRLPKSVVEPPDKTMTGVEMSIYITGLGLDEVLLSHARLLGSRSPEFPGDSSAGVSLG